MTAPKQRSLLLLLLLLLLCCTPPPAAAAVTLGPRLEVAVEVQPTIIARTLEQYVSADIDWWHNTTHDCAPSQGRTCWGDAGALWLDLTHPLLRAAAAALSPGFLRIGGSLVRGARRRYAHMLCPLLRPFVTAAICIWCARMRRTTTSSTSWAASATPSATHLSAPSR
eukprot:COSAG01_NODE_9635_length_2383_cov_2.828809_1_plen_168_part_00